MTDDHALSDEIESLLADDSVAARILLRTFDAVTVGDLEGRILWVNDAVCAQTGLSRDQLIGHTDDEFDFYLEPETRAELAVALRDRGRFGPAPGRFRVAGGAIQHVELYAELIEFRERPLVMVISRALTEQVEAESRLREAEITFRSLVEQLPGAVYLEQLPGSAKSEKKVTLYVSPRYREMFGLEPRQDTPTLDTWRRIVHPDDLGRVVAESDRTDETQEAFRCEYRVVPEGRPEMWVRDEAVLVRDDDGQPRYWLGLITDISDRIRADEELRAAEQKLRALVEQLPVAVYTQSPEDRESFYLSPQMARITGYSLADFDAVGFWESKIHPEDHDAVMAEAHRTDASLEPFDMEYRMVAADGGVIWIHEVSVPVRTREGGPVGLWQGIFEDVTERKLAEARLSEAEERYRTLVEHIPVATYTQVFAAEEGYFMSPQIEEISGYPAAAFQDAEGWARFVHPDDLERVNSEAERTDRERETFDMEYRLLRPDGSVVWIHDVAVLIEQTGERPPVWQGVIEDITERKHAEAQLREAEERYRTLVERVPAVTYQERVSRGSLPGSYPESTVVYMSPQVESILGYPLEEFERDPRMFWERLVFEEDRDEVVAESERSTIVGDTYDQEYRVRRGDGTIGWLRDEAVRVGIEPDGTQIWHGFLTDITKRKDAEAELEIALRLEREAVDRLRSLDEMKNTFLNAVSHDLRTPLAAIHGLALTLERDDLPLEPQESRDLAGRIASNSRKLERLVTDLLDLDRLSRGILEPQLATTDLSALVRKVIDEADFARDHPVIVEAEPIAIAADAAKVERIVENLVANSIRHTPGGTRVWVRVQPQGEGALILIEDEGPGVDPSLTEEIFQPFSQGSTYHAHSPGVGIGLSLVARFAELHGGRAWVEDREGGGASFRVFLPGTVPERPGGKRRDA